MLVNYRYPVSNTDSLPKYQKIFLVYNDNYVLYYVIILYYYLYIIILLLYYTMYML